MKPAEAEDHATVKRTVRSRLLLESVATLASPKDAPGAPLPHPAESGGGVYVTVLLNTHHLNGAKTGKRKAVRAKVLKSYPKSLLVQLPNGDVVKRNLKRDVVEVQP
jgi:hypothetical protein